MLFTSGVFTSSQSNISNTPNITLRNPHRTVCKSRGPYRLKNCNISELEKRIYCDYIVTTPSASPPIPDTPFFDVLGEIEAYVSHNESHSEAILSYAIKTDTNISSNSSSGNEFNSIPLRLNVTQTPQLVTGDMVKIKVKNTASNRRRLQDLSIPTIAELDVESIEPSGEAPQRGKDFVIDGKPVNITSVTFLVSVCGQTPVVTHNILRARYFNAFAPSNYVTLQSMHSTCSYNKLRFLPENNIIVSNITLPCAGTFNGAKYNSSKCDSAEIYGWMNDAIIQARAQGVNLSKYKRRIMMLPSRPACPWGGLASVGCTTSCNTWINTSPTSSEIDMPTLFQELAHNIGLMHSNRNISWASAEYGDCTDPMGCGGPNPTQRLTTMSCINAPQQYKAGWSSPAYNIDFANIFPLGTYASHTLPALALSDKSMMRIKISSLPPTTQAFSPRLQEHVLYISYRVRQPAPGYDSGLTDDMNARTYIYTYNTTITNPPYPDPSLPPFKPMLIGVLDNSTKRISRMPELKASRLYTTWFPNLQAGIALRFDTKTTINVTISVCKMASQTESTEDECIDGIDNDCNGLADIEEPGCMGYYGISSSPPSPPLPSPPRPPKARPPPPKLRSPPPKSKTT